MIRLYSNGKNRYTDFDFNYLDWALQNLAQNGICDKNYQHCDRCKCRQACNDLEKFIEYVSRENVRRRTRNSDFVK